MLWGLCVNGEGDFIRNPNEILQCWTLEQVLDALEIKRIRKNIRVREQAALKAAGRR